jgi:hypothetical protein
MPFGAEQGPSAGGRKAIAKGIGIYTLIWFVVFLFRPAFFVRNVQILLPSFAVLAIFLCFSLWLRFQVQDNVLGEIGFVYLALAVAYTVFPAYAFLVLDSLSSGAGFQKLAELAPDQGELGLQLWRQVLFIAAIGFGYLLFRGKVAPKSNSIRNSGDTDKPIIRTLFVAVLFSVIALWSLSAPVDTYIDNYTRYDNLSWIGRRVVTICVVLKTGGTLVLLTILFRNYRRYRLYIWAFVLLRAIYEVRFSLGSRIEAFEILMAAAILYHYCFKRITLKRGLLVMLAFGLVFSVIEMARSSDFDFSAFKETASQDQGMPAGELAALFVPGFHLYSERSQGTLPPVEWQVFFNDFISLVPLVDQTKWNPMYWYARNYFPDAIVPPMTLGPIAVSALWGGEIGLAILGLINGALFAFLMRWFAREGGRWQVMTIYVFCYSTCIMCLKHSIFYHLAPLVKIILPLLLIVSILAKNIQASSKLRGNRQSRRTATGIASESLRTT